MNTDYLFYLAASTYDCGEYGAGAYQENTCTTVGVPDTGFAANLGTPYFIGGALLLAVALVLSISLLIRKRRG